jgi:serine/threonine-protein kinase RsbW
MARLDDMIMNRQGLFAAGERSSMTVEAKQSKRVRRLAKLQVDRDLLALRFYDVIPSTFEALDEVIDTLLILAREMKCNQESLDEIELAMREALANAIIHGNKQDPNKRVAVRAYCQPDRGLLLVIDDEGSGFDPTKVPNPTGAECLYQTHGRGLFKMRRLMDKVRISRKGTRITLVKKLK